MKLAHALILRGDLQKRLASLRERLARNALVQEGSEPHEDPASLLAEAKATIAQLEGLVVSINKVNLESRLPDGRSLTAALAHRDALVQQHSLLASAIAAAQKEPDRYSVREIKWKSAIDVKALQRSAEQLASLIRDQNALLQETNWQIDL